jgi:hypothetical protein
MRKVSREELPSDFFVMMEYEAHHDHEIIMDNAGMLRWKDDPEVRKLLIEYGGCTDNIIQVIRGMGYDNNSEVLRKFYRDCGLMLVEYFDILYGQNGVVDIDYVPHVLTPTETQPTNAITSEWLRACTKLRWNGDEFRFSYRVQDVPTKLIYSVKNKYLRLEQGSPNPSVVIIGRPITRHELIDMISAISFEPKENLYK